MDIGDNSEPNKVSTKSRKDKVLDPEKAAKVKQMHPSEDSADFLRFFLLSGEREG